MLLHPTEILYRHNGSGGYLGVMWLGFLGWVFSDLPIDLHRRRLVCKQGANQLSCAVTWREQGESSSLYSVGFLGQWTKDKSSVSFYSLSWPSFCAGERGPPCAWGLTSSSKAEFESGFQTVAKMLVCACVWGGVGEATSLLCAVAQNEPQSVMLLVINSQNMKVGQISFPIYPDLNTLYHLQATE